MTASVFGWKYRAENYQKALEDFQTALDKEAYYNRGNARAVLGKKEMAIEDFEKALELDDENAKYYKNRVNVHYQLGNTQQACRDWQKAMDFGDERADFFINKYCD